jgi:protein-L-isoaspartate(D-aspartate) O-methyltransferase
MKSPDEFAVQRILMDTLRMQMVKEQIEMRGVHNPRLLDVLRSVPRHCFVPAESRLSAYDDKPLPIGQGQTISQPYMVAVMTDLLGLTGSEKILEIGTGCGYQAAVLSQLASIVETIEFIPALASQSAHMLAELGCANVHVHAGDGTQGWPAAAPYDGILVTAAAPSVPERLLTQLAENGRLVIPVGGKSGQVLQLWSKKEERFEIKALFQVSFVPLRGASGWSDADWQSHRDIF